MSSSKRVGLSLLGPVLVMVLLFVFSREEAMVDTRLSKPAPVPAPQTPPYHSSPNGSILSLAQSRFASAVTDSMFKAKQQVLNSLCVGEFDQDDLSADGFRHASPQASALYAKWSNLSRTQECVANRRLYLVGTSFQRSILWSLLRRLMGGLEQVPEEYRLISSVPALVREKDPSTGKCDANVNGTRYEIQPVPWNTSVPSCLLVKNKNCEHPGPAGIQLEPCGLPMSAKWKQPGTDTTVLYQFKTYVNAPAVDKRVFATLKANKWDVVWLESGEWGSWGTPHERERTTYQESLDFLRKVARAFPGWIVVSGNSAYTEQNLLFLAAARSMAERHGDRMLVFDQKPLVQAADRRNVRQGHGYYGAATDVMVRVFLALVCDEGGWEKE